jgi:hypothetical protein
MCESIFVMLSLIFPTITIVCETSIFVVGTIVCVRHFCDIPPLSRGGQSKPGSIRGANTEALTHNTHIHGPNTELLHKFLSYKEIHR